MIVPPCTSNAAFFSMSAIWSGGMSQANWYSPDSRPLTRLGDFRHLDEADALDRRTAAPVFVMRLERQRHVGLELDDLVGAGRDRLARPVEIARGFLPAAAVDDVGAVARQAAFERDVGRRVVRSAPCTCRRPRRASRSGQMRRATAGTSAGSSLPGRGVGICSKAWMVPRFLASVLPNMRSRLKVKTTSSAVISSPLWNFTPWRSFSSTVWSSMRRHSVARPGTAPRLPRQFLRRSGLPRSRRRTRARRRSTARAARRAVRIGDLLHGDRDRRAVVGLPDRKARQEKRARGSAAGLQDGATGEASAS